MNIVLNSPLPTLASKEYDNKILFAFVLMMSTLVLLSVIFISVTKEISKTSPAVEEEQVSPMQVGEYV